MPGPLWGVLAALACSPTSRWRPLRPETPYRIRPATHRTAAYCINGCPCQAHRIGAAPGICDARRGCPKRIISAAPGTSRSPRGGGRAGRSLPRSRPPSPRRAASARAPDRRSHVRRGAPRRSRRRGTGGRGPPATVGRGPAPGDRAHVHSKGRGGEPTAPGGGGRPRARRSAEGGSRRVRAGGGARTALRPGRFSFIVSRTAQVAKLVDALP